MSDLPTLTFTPDAGGVAVDVEQLIRSRMLIQASSGGGKSYALRYLLEQTHGHVQQLVLDPEGEFSTLREVYPYVLAGREGDVPSTPETAALLCRRLMELGASAIIDLYDLTPQERKHYVRLFLEELMALPRELWRPCLVVIDEVHVYSPERGAGEAESTGAVVTLASQGRKRGYCLVAATQRLSKVHKDVAAECGNRLIGRTTLDVDLRRAADDLGLGKDQWPALKTLTAGQFYAYGPAISDQVQLVQTGEVRTRHPQAGAVASAPPPPPEALRELLAQLVDLPAQAEEEARTADELRAEIARLRAALRERPAPEIVVERYPVPVFHAGDLAVLSQARDDLHRAIEALPKVYGDIEASFGRILSGCREIQQDEPRRRELGRIHTELGTRDPERESERLAEFAAAELPPPYRPSPLRKAYPHWNEEREDFDRRRNTPSARLTLELAKQVNGAPEPEAEPAPASQGIVKLRAGERRILEALARMHPLRITEAQLGVLAKLTPSGGTWNSYWTALRGAGHVVKEGGLVGITPAGFAALGRQVPPSASTPQERLELYRSLLKPQPRRMLEIIARHTHGISREDLADTIGLAVSGGTFGSYLGTLRQNDLVEDARGILRLNARLFGSR